MNDLQVSLAEHFRGKTPSQILNEIPTMDGMDSTSIICADGHSVEDRGEVPDWVCHKEEDGE